VEGVCVSSPKEECDSVSLILSILRRVHEDLALALDRTPYTISSKPLIESSLKLVESSINETLRLGIMLGCRASTRESSILSPG